MATTVGGTLASSELAVAQDDIHLTGSCVDQLTIRFDQLAFDDLFAADQTGPSQRRLPEDHRPATRGVAPSSTIRRQQPRTPKRGSGPLTRDGQPPRGFPSPRRTRIRRTRTSADAEGPPNIGHIPAARILQEAEIEPLYEILLHKRKIRPLAQSQLAYLTRHPKFCAYHQLVGHPTSKCRSLKERLEGLVRKGVVATNAHSETSNANAAFRRHRTPRSPGKALSLPSSGQTGPMGALLTRPTTFHAPVSSTLLADKAIEGAWGIFFEVPASRPDQKPILFRRYQRKDFPRPREMDEQGEPDYSWVSPKVTSMMERWGYRFEDKEGLNHGKGRRTPLEACNIRGVKDYRGLGYSTAPDQSDVDSNPLARYDHSPDTSSFSSDPSIVTLFEPVSVNMVSAQPEPDDDEIELINTEDDPWIRHLNTLWDIRFEQREPPTDDALLQVNMGDEANPKPIYISDTLSLEEKADLIALIREYIDVFVWHYEDMPGLDPKVAVHRLNIKEGAKPVKQPQRRFRPDIMDAIEQEVRKLIDSGFIREEQHPDWVSNIASVTKKNGSICICIDFCNLCRHPNLP